MSVKICEKAIDIICASSIPIPFLGIVMKKGFVHQRVRVLEESGKTNTGDNGMNYDEPHVSL